MTAFEPTPNPLLLAALAPRLSSIWTWLDPLLTFRLLGISASSWLWSLLAVTCTYVGTRIIVRLVLRRLSKVSSTLVGRSSGLVTTLVAETGWYSCLALGIYFGTRHLDLPSRAEKVLSSFMVIAFAIQAGVWAQKALRQVIEAWRDRQASPHGATVAAGLNFAVRLVTWVLLGIFALSNLGIEVGAMIAGLGVGGVAAALAVQNILGDVFAGVSMYFDRPFDIGDSIAIGDIRGEVERIGLRTTRIAGLDGEQIIVPNGDIGKSRIKNFARLRRRRMVITFSLEHETKSADLKLAKDLTAQIIQAEPEALLERVHCVRLSDLGADFEGVYFVQSGNHKLAMDVQERILFAVSDGLEHAGLRIAQPGRFTPRAQS